MVDAALLGQSATHSPVFPKGGAFGSDLGTGTQYQKEFVSRLSPKRMGGGEFYEMCLGRDVGNVYI